MERRILELESGEYRMNPSSDICITVFLRGEKHTIMTCQGEYRNLMALLYDKFYIEDFGECKGTGRCGTCHILIKNYTDEWLKREGNEDTTLTKMGSVSRNSRLACQVMIDRKLHGLQIEVVSG